MSGSVKALDHAHTSRADWCLECAEWQSTLFAERPSRAALAKLAPSWPRQSIRIRVQRNQAFEFVASAMASFLAYAGYVAEFAYSDYDDSLSLALAGSGDLEIVWLDYERYQDKFDADGLVAWLVERLGALRKATDAPVLISDRARKDELGRAFNAQLREAASALPDVGVCDQAAIEEELGETYYDPRAARIAGMALGDAACIQTARMYGLVWIPGRLRPRLKAILLDLDGTLYHGVLGEDGVEGIVLEAAHVDLQRRLLALRDDGLFLAIVSRNEPEDVERLLTEREDFPLRLDHVSARAISWSPKADGVAEIAEALRIAPDSMLVIDDNPGELAALAEALPDIHCLHAEADATGTCRALKFYPGLARSAAINEADALRVADLASSAEREALAASASDPLDYLRSLRIELGFAMNPRTQLARLAELSNKTNQFNLALGRFTETEVARRLDDPECRTVAISLSDRLSNSGVIGALFACRQGTVLNVDELCVSCRALGRRLEDVMIGESVGRILEQLPAETVRFTYRAGPRNSPARDWLTNYSGTNADAPEGAIALVWDAETVGAEIERMPITLLWRDDDD